MPSISNPVCHLFQKHKTGDRTGQGVKECLNKKPILECWNKTFRFLFGKYLSCFREDQSPASILLFRFFYAVTSGQLSFIIGIWTKSVRLIAKFTDQTLFNGILHNHSRSTIWPEGYLNFDWQSFDQVRWPKDRKNLCNVCMIIRFGKICSRPNAYLICFDLDPLILSNVIQSSL